MLSFTPAANDDLVSSSKKSTEGFGAPLTNMQESLQYDCSNSGNELQSIQYPQRQLPSIELISLYVEEYTVVKSSDVSFDDALEDFDDSFEDLDLDDFPEVTGSHT
jgi:hypothetical protein